MNQVQQLIKINIFSFLHKLRYNWARELVAIACSAVLVALFLYMLQDFLTEQVINISVKMYQSFTGTLTKVSCITSGALIANSIKKSRIGYSELALFAQSMGESKSCLDSFLAMRLAFLIGLIVSITYMVTSTFFEPIHKDIVYNMSSGLFGLITIALNPKESDKTDEANTMGSYSLYRWRFYQITKRNPACKVLIITAIGLSFLHGIIAAKDLPIFVHGLWSFFICIIAIIPLTIQLKEDLNYAWAERVMGVSHSDIMKTYFKLATTTATAIILPSCICYLLPSIINSRELNFDAIAIIIMITATITIQAPCFFFQLEPRSPFQTTLTITIINLFQVTAIIFHWGFILAVPIIGYYSSAYQNNRYYRS